MATVSAAISIVDKNDWNNFLATNPFAPLADLEENGEGSYTVTTRLERRKAVKKAKQAVRAAEREKFKKAQKKGTRWGDVEL